MTQEDTKSARKSSKSKSKTSTKKVVTAPTPSDKSLQEPSSPSPSQGLQAMSKASNQNNDASRHWMPIARLHNNFQGIQHSSDATLGQGSQEGTPLATWLTESYCDAPWHPVGEVGVSNHVSSNLGFRGSPNGDPKQSVKKKMSTSKRAADGSYNSR